MQLLAKPLAGHYFNVVDASNLGTLFTSIFQAIACPPNLVVSKAVTEATAAPGATLHYAITVSNNGGTDATNVAVHDPISALLAHGTWGSCDNSCSHDANSVDWTIPTVAAGNSVTVHFTINLSLGGWNAGQTVLVNTVVVANSNCAAQSVDAACTKSTTVTASPHLSITKSATADLSKAGDVIHYTIVATNDGNTTLASVTVSDATVSNLGTARRRTARPSPRVRR